MQSEFWKEPLLKLSLDELKKAQCFIVELIQNLESLQNTKEDTIVIFPPQNNLKVEERRTEKRFDMELKGVCSIVKKDEPDISTEKSQEEMPIHIKDISKHGIRFTIDKYLMPSSILTIKFQLPSSSYDKQLYKNPQKKIYVEVMRVSEFTVPAGIKYTIGAKSIESERVAELLKEEKNRVLVNNRLALKGDVRILIVTIKETLSKFLEDILLKQGYVVYKANQKQQAIATLRKSKCNIIVSDIETAGINDFELIEDIKEEFPDVGLIVEINTIEDWNNLSRLGVDNYLTKNFNDKEFNIILDSLYKNLLQRSMFGDYFGLKQRGYQNILVISKSEELRQIFCNISIEKGLKLFFVNNIEYAVTALRKYKIDFVYLDTDLWSNKSLQPLRIRIDSINEDMEVTNPEGCQFIMNIKKDFYNIKTAVASKNLKERCEFLVSGANHFIGETVDMHKILEILGQL